MIVPTTRKIEWLDELWAYRELFYFLVWRDIIVRYKQTLLGATWVVIQPLGSMIVFTLVFGKLAKMPSDGVPYALFSFAALVPWNYFDRSISRSGNSLLSNANLITKVYFPRVILVASSILNGLLDYGISFLVFLGLMYYFGIPLGWKILLWPLLTIVLVLLSFGVGMILSSLNVRYRDIGYTIPFAMQLWFFITPIIYPTSIIPENYRGLASLNPMYGIIQGFRSAILPSRQVDWQQLSISVTITLLLLVVGYFYFRKTERYFADII
jgi:lipopolysaccharide transport system permease protein